MNHDTPAANLCYLDAAQVEHPSGTMAGLMMCTEDDERLGALSGVLLEPASRRVRYFVVQGRGMVLPHRYVLDADTPAVLDAGDRKIRVHAKRADLERFDVRSVRRYSDEDAVTAMFAEPAA